jgi:hypothetical protein
LGRPRRHPSSPASRPAATASGSIVTEHQTIGNLVVDATSIEVNRRQRRAKSDKLDATKLVSMLIRWYLGEEKA